MNNFPTQAPSFDLPKKLARLGDLACNLWWTWQPEAGRLYSQLDRAMWERLNHNPIRMLREIKRARLYEVLKDKFYMDSYKRVFADFDAYMADQDTWAQQTQLKLASNPIAYFSMEFGLHEIFPIYSGGLGVLAGDPGTATAHSDITLHLFADRPESVAVRLMDRGIRHEVAERRFRVHRDGFEAYPAVRFTAGGHEVDATIFPRDGIRQAPPGPVDGRPMRRATLAEIEELLVNGNTPLREGPLPLSFGPPGKG